MGTQQAGGICVVGAGTMGPLIALQFAYHGLDVHLLDTVPDALDRAEEKIKENLKKRIAQGDIPPDTAQKTCSLIDYGTHVEEIVGEADFVIESITENLDRKIQLFGQLDQACPDHTILATNSSSIRSSLLARATRRPDKVVNMHFLYPVWERPLVEVMGSKRTSQQTIQATVNLGMRIGLTPIVVNGETTGFVFRVWRAMKHEALNIVGQGHASFEDVDRALMIGIPAPMGPFMAMDQIGLDVILAVEERWYEESGDERDRPAGILVRKVKNGELGAKTGRGFYQYPNPSYQRPGWLQGRLDQTQTAKERDSRREGVQDRGRSR